MSARNTVVRTTAEKSRPPALSSAPMFSMTCAFRPRCRPSRDCRSPDRSAPARKRTAAVRREWPASRGRSLSGARELETACFTLHVLGGFDDLIRAQTPRAHADPLDAAVDHGPHGLKVRLEPARADVVRVAVLPADDGTLPANLAFLRHWISSVERNPKYIGGRVSRDDQIGLRHDQSRSRLGGAGSRPGPSRTRPSRSRYARRLDGSAACSLARRLPRSAAGRPRHRARRPIRRACRPPRAPA